MLIDWLILLVVVISTVLSILVLISVSKNSSNRRMGFVTNSYSFPTNTGQSELYLNNDCVVDRKASSPILQDQITIAVVTAVYKRPEITRRVLEYYEHVRKNLQGIVNLQLYAVGSEGYLSRKMCEDAGWSYIEFPNKPLSDKWNAIIASLRNIPFDALFITGSDDIVSENLFLEYARLLSQGCLFIGIRDMYTIDLLTGKALYFGGYKERKRGESCIGLARCFHRTIVEKLDFRLWENGLNRNLDNSQWKLLLKIVPDIMEKQCILSIRDYGFVAIDIKGGLSITTFESLENGQSTLGVMSIQNGLEYLRQIVPTLMWETLDKIVVDIESAR